MVRTPVPEPGTRASREIEVLREQREANEKLVLAALRGDEREGELLATAELRERLIGVIAHDLRTPLNTILLGTSQVLAHGDVSPRDAVLLGRVVSSGERMARMITQILEFTRVRTGGDFVLAPAPCDLVTICANVCEELRVASPTEIRLTSEGDLAGVWDADRLAQAFSNVVGNAIEHASPGEPIVVALRGDGAWAVAEVTNVGAAIPADVLPGIFEPFRGASVRDAAGRRSVHLGLGLYIAHEIARAHRGTLEVRSAEGATTFIFRLPLAPPAARA